jgi:hypothetical protein
MNAKMVRAWMSLIPQEHRQLGSNSSNNLDSSKTFNPAPCTLNLGATAAITLTQELSSQIRGGARVEEVAFGLI